MVQRAGRTYGKAMTAIQADRLMALNDMRKYLSGHLDYGGRAVLYAQPVMTAFCLINN